MNIVSSGMDPDLSRSKKFAKDELPRVFDQARRPSDGSLTEAEWLLDRRCKLRPGARPSALLYSVHHEPYTHRTSWCPLPAWEIDLLRRLLLDGDDPGSVPANAADSFGRAFQAKHVVAAYLYPESEVVPIAKLTQAQAATILERRWLCPGSSRQQHIEAQDVDAVDELRTTTLTMPGRLNVTSHRNGRQHQGLRAGDASRLVVFDGDRHGGSVPLDEQVLHVRGLLGHIQEHYTDTRPHATNINPANASCHVAAYIPRCWKRDMIAIWVEALREDFSWLKGWQVYPVDLPQVYMPMRMDKATVIDGPLPRATHRIKVGGKMRKVEGHDWVAYLDWLESDRPCDLDAVERTLRSATVPDAPIRPADDRKEGGKATKGGTGMTACEGHRGRERQIQVDYWEGRLVPSPGESGRVMTFALRYLVVAEGFKPEAAVDWILQGVGRLPDTLFILRLSRPNGRKLLEKSLLVQARRYAKDNGWQRDPEASTEKLLAVKRAWDRVGFLLSDRSTWHITGKGTPQRRHLTWEADLADFLPRLSEAASCSVEMARELAEEVATHVAAKCELSLTYLGHIMERVGLKNYANKQVRLRSCLENVGFLVRRKNGYQDVAVGTRRGSVYVLGASVRFVGAVEAGGASPRCPAVPAARPDLCGDGAADTEPQGGALLAPCPRPSPMASYGEEYDTPPREAPPAPRETSIYPSFRVPPLPPHGPRSSNIAGEGCDGGHGARRGV